MGTVMSVLPRVCHNEQLLLTAPPSEAARSLRSGAAFLMIAQQQDCGLDRYQERSMYSKRTRLIFVVAVRLLGRATINRQPIWLGYARRGPVGPIAKGTIVEVTRN